MKKILFTLLFFPIFCFSQNLCDDIALITDDKFDNSRLYSSPLLENVSILKSISKGKIIYYLDLECNGITLNVGEKGAFVLFEDKTKLMFYSEKIDVEAADGDYKYSAFIKLTPEQLNKIEKVRITDIKLSIYTKEIDEGLGNNVKSYVTCLKTIK